MAEALLQAPSGRVVERLPLAAPEPDVIEHGGYRWWSHRCASGVTYSRGRALNDRAPSQAHQVKR